MHRVGAPDRRRRRLGQPEVAHLALLHELGHRPDGLLDRHVEVHAVLVVEVDEVHSEALERCVAGPAYVLGAAVDAEAGAVLGALVAELRCDHEIVAAAADRTAYQALVGERPVHVGSVEERDTELDRALDGGHGLVLVGRAVELGHPHAPEAELRHLEPP